MLLVTKSSLIEKDGQKKLLVYFRFSKIDLVPLREMALCLDKLTCTLFPQTHVEDRQPDTFFLTQEA